jgi:phage terminase large subunit-like protein
MTKPHKRPVTVKQVIERAIKCGYKPNLNNLDVLKWVDLPVSKLTTGQKVCVFAYKHLVVPEGKDVGKPLLLDEAQVAFILSVFDNPVHTRKGILSESRRNGKTFTVAVILLAFIVGSLAVQNSTVASAAHSREQAALCFRLMSLMLQHSKTLDGLYRIVPSSKRIVGLRKNVEYMALSADAKTGHGKSLRVLLLDEAGQFVESENEYISMLRTSQGSYDDARLFIISTQAPSDHSFLSLEIDASIREGSEGTVTHLYAADPDCDLMDEKQWYYANPGLGKYRSITDLREQIKDAIVLPAKLPGVMNLLLNMRVAQESVFISPAVWKENMAKPDLEVFRRSDYVSCGLDLSLVNDLSCAVLCAKDDDDNVHVLCYAFSPLGGIRERSLRDRVPYDEWARTGVIYAPPGDTLNYDLIAQYLRVQMEELGIEISEVHFDRFRIDVFRAACEREGFAANATFTECGQGFVSMGCRLDALETALLGKKMRLGNNPILNLGASSAIVESDNVGNRRLTKKKSANKIDGLVSLTMAAWPLVAPTKVEFSAELFIG